MERSLLCRAEEQRKCGCLQLANTCGASDLNLSSLFCFRTSKYVARPRLQDGFPLSRPASKKYLKEGIISWNCPVFVETGMEDLGEKKEVRSDGSDSNCCGSVSFSESSGKHQRSHSSSEASSSRSSGSRNESHVGSDEASKEASEFLGWSMRNSSVSSSFGNGMKIFQDDDNADKAKHCPSEIDMMKERFAKLLLGEDMSGCGKGVCTAVAVSNAITNLFATVFGQLWRLEPLSDDKKSMWRREMEWLVCVSDHIVEFKPSWQTFHDGRKLEVMSCRPRSDLYINLPALQKLDNMLIEVLDSFRGPEFWYVDKVILAQDVDVSSSFRRSTQHQEKWWLPSPRVPLGGICEKTRKQLEYRRECTNQILKAAMSINSNALSEMEVPESYTESLPKNGRTSLGDVIYRYITSEQFSPEHLLDCLHLSTEHQALDIANRVEAASFIWHRRTVAQTPRNSMHTNTRTSWGMVKEIMLVDGGKREMLAVRADNLLLYLKQRFPGLTQTTLDMSKIQFNKDVGKSILEAYSRILECLAFNIIARIDDLLYVDDLAENTDQISSVPAVSAAHKSATMPCSKPSTCKASHARIISLSPAPLISPARGGERKSYGLGFGVKKVLTD